MYVSFSLLILSYVQKIQHHITRLICNILWGFSLYEKSKRILSRMEKKIWIPMILFLAYALTYTAQCSWLLLPSTYLLILSMLKQFVKENTWLKLVHHGYWNGYVVVPKTYEYLNAYDNVPVHWGITFHETVRSARWNYKHFWPYLEWIPDSYIIIGFDTCHAWDDERLNKKWCIQETKRLAKGIEKINHELEQLENTITFLSSLLEEKKTKLSLLLNPPF